MKVKDVLKALGNVNPETEVNIMGADGVCLLVTAGDKDVVTFEESMLSFAQAHDIEPTRVHSKPQTPEEEREYYFPGYAEVLIK
jgi:hypothetical protein